ncbi:MAG TPA: VWA domain-containing protein [Bryobacteraceae bacterium]|nr:VWA domain-containing protein [Bryobacteraceae bacterium]
MLPLLVLSLALPAQDTTIKVDVDLVNVLCSVRNKGNGLVGNLEKGDFHLFEDGKEMEIKYFTRETDLPLTIGMLVDTSKSQENLIEPESRAAYEFFKVVLRKKDMAFLMQFGAEAELLQDNTNSAKMLQDGLRQLRLSVPVGGLHPGPVPTAQNQAGTILFDAIYLAAGEKLKGEVGRKVIVVITDGDDTGSKTPRDRATEAAQKADSIIYFVDYEDPRYHGGGFGTFTIGRNTGNADMSKMSSETGGRVFRVDRKNTLDDIFKELQDEMRSQYSIGYTSPHSQKDGSYHKIEIRTSNKDYKVQARKGYYAIPQEN